MKTTIERRENYDAVALRASQYAGTHKRRSGKVLTRLFSPIAILLAMVIAILLLDAILPVRDLWFHDALLTQMGNWPVWPSLLLLHNWALIPHLPFQHSTTSLTLLQGWTTYPLLLGALVAVFGVYLLAVRRLPGSISWRFIWRSTLLIGFIYLLIPVVTSPDLFSYIAYARMGILHDLNPLTTIPSAIHNDAVYKYVFWVDQPSAYGPTWAIITSLLQGGLALVGNRYVMPMVLALRLLGLATHLISARLVWSISGQLQQLNGQPVQATRKRIGATLAFAWNPLLLFEACVNAHNDSTLLVFVLLVIWVLAHDKIRKMYLDSGFGGMGSDDPAVGVQDIAGRARGIPGRPQGSPLPYYGIPRDGRIVAGALVVYAAALMMLYEIARRFAPLFEKLSLPVKKGIERIPLDLRAPVAAACLLALGTCLKINAVVLLPGLLCYVWVQAPGNHRIQHAAVTLGSYVVVVVLSYAPFWQGGAIFDVFQVNPATYRAINTLAEFMAHSYNSVATLVEHATGTPIGSPAEHFLHTFSMGIFVLLYLVMLWRMVRATWRLRSLRGLIYWMAVAWLLYCAIGSPWYWPWYIVTFLGLFALLEATDEDASTENQGTLFPWSLPFMHNPWIARLLTFSMFTMYSFMTGPMHSFIYGLPGFQWSDMTGAWGWLVPVIGIALAERIANRNRPSKGFKLKKLILHTLHAIFRQRLGLFMQRYPTGNENDARKF